MDTKGSNEEKTYNNNYNSFNLNQNKAKKLNSNKYLSNDRIHTLISARNIYNKSATQNFNFLFNKISLLKDIKYNYKIKIIDTIIFLLIITNLILAFVSNNLFTEDKGEIGSPNYKERNSSNLSINILRIINLIICITMEILIFFHYYIILQKYKSKDLACKRDGIFSVGLYKGLIIEMIILGIFSPPYYDYILTGNMLTGYFAYSLDTIITVLCLFKGYYIIKIIKHYSPFTSNKAKNLAEQKKRIAGFYFAIKAHLNKSPFVFLIITFCCSALYCGSVLRSVEYSYNPDKELFSKEIQSAKNADLKSFLDIIWLTIISMTTVGYGDIYPQTHFGRILMILSSLVGTFITSMLISYLSKHIEFNSEQKKAYSIIMKVESIDETKNIAASNIRLLCKIRLFKEKIHKLSEQKSKTLKNPIISKARYHNNRNIFINNSEFATKSIRKLYFHNLLFYLNKLSISIKKFDKKFKSVQTFFLPSDKVLSNVCYNFNKNYIKLIDWSFAINLLKNELKTIHKEESNINIGFENVNTLLNKVIDNTLVINSLCNKLVS